jgi:CelD/BcsL family acetyltransferase involved in cellulose biosynthesis
MKTHYRYSEQPAPAALSPLRLGPARGPHPASEQIARLVNNPAAPPLARSYDVEVTFGSTAEDPELVTFASDSRIFMPFQLPFWGKAWQDTVGASHRVDAVAATVRCGGTVAAVLSMTLRRSALLNTLTWHAENLSDYGAPLLSGNDGDLLPGCNVAELLGAVAGKIGGVDLIHLSKQPAMLGGRTNPFVLPHSVEHHVSAHAINFLPGEAWDDFLARTRSSSTRQQLRKKQRNLAKLGTVAFHIAATGEEAAGYIQHCLDAKSKQLARLGHFDPFTSANNRAFIADYFTRHAGSSTWAVALTLDGQPIASAFGFAGARQWLLYQMAMDGEGTAQTSPGTQLLMHIMQHCIASGITRLDLAMGDEGYKQEWCDEHQTLFTTILPVSAKGRLVGGVMRQVAVASKKIAGHDRLYDLAKSAKRWLQKLVARG